LIESQINSDSRRGDTEDFPLNTITLGDDSANTYDLARRGFTPESVPAEGQRVLIQRNGNVAFDVTGQLHPSVAAMAALAARLVGRMLKLTGKHVGLACGDGLFFDRRLAKKGNCANRTSAHRVLLTRSVQAAVFENGRRTILSEGLAYDRCSVGVVTNVVADDT